MASQEETNARKDPIGAGEAVTLVRKASRLVAIRGKKSIVVEPTRNSPNDDELATLVVGPSGKLRAPTIRFGKTVIVGFNPDSWLAELT